MLKCYIIRDIPSSCLGRSTELHTALYAYSIDTSTIPNWVYTTLHLVGMTYVLSELFMYGVIYRSGGASNQIFGEEEVKTTNPG